MESQGMAQYLLKASTIKLGTRRFSHLVLVDGVLAKIPLDPLDKELERRGHRFARYTALGVHMTTRSRKGYWRMSSNSILQRALTNRWLQAQGVPDMRTLWITLHYGPDARV
jgi:hypothetical protein